jgi:hypothetical protein
MPDIYDNCGTGNKTISCLSGTTKTARIEIGGPATLLKFTIVSMTATPAASPGNISKISLHGGTDSGYDIVYYIEQLVAGNPSVTSWIMTQDVDYVDLVIENNSSPAVEFTVIYKIECPIAVGERYDLHWSLDTDGHACDLDYNYSTGHGEGDTNGYTGLLPFFLENGVLEVGNRVFGFPINLITGAGEAGGYLMTSNQRGRWYTPQYPPVSNPYQSALHVGIAYPNFTGSVNEFNFFRVSDGYYSDGTVSIYVDIDGVIQEVADCVRQDYHFESNHYRNGSNAYISCYHIGSLGNVTSDVEITFRIRGNTTSAQMDGTLTVYDGTSSNFENFPLTPAFNGTEDLTFTPYTIFPAQDGKFIYFKPPY